MVVGTSWAEGPFFDFGKMLENCTVAKTHEKSRFFGTFCEMVVGTSWAEGPFFCLAEKKIF